MEALANVKDDAVKMGEITAGIRKSMTLRELNLSDNDLSKAHQIIRALGHASALTFVDLSRADLDASFKQHLGLRLKVAKGKPEDVL